MKSNKSKLLTLIFLSALFLFLSIPNISAHAEDYGMLNTNKETLIKGQTLKLKVYYSTGKVNWKSSNKRIATVSSKGKVTAKRKGSAIIYAIINNKKLKCKIKVEEPKISKKYITIKNDENFQLYVSGTKKDVTWSSSNESIAAINSDGLLMAKDIGKTKITAKIDNKKYYCNVTVIDHEGSRTNPISAYVPYTTDIYNYGTFVGKFKIQLLDYKDGTDAYEYITKNDEYKKTLNPTQEYIYVKYSIEYLTGQNQVNATDVVNHYSDFFNSSSNYQLDNISYKHGYEDTEDMINVNLYPGGNAICSKTIIIRSGNTPITYRLETGYDNDRYEKKYTWFTTTK